MKEILRRLEALEARLNPPAVERDGQAIARLTARLEEMAERLRASPDWTEPGESEIAATMLMMEGKYPGIGARMREEATA